MCRYKEKPYIEDLQSVDIGSLKGELRSYTKALTATINNHTVRLLPVASNYGGQRYYFECPSCFKRVRKLYWFRQVYQCRKCTGLLYRSQGVSKESQALHQANKLWGKLNEDGSKPKWMRWPTYERICDEAEYYESLHQDLYQGRMAARPIPRKILHLCGLI